VRVRKPELAIGTRACNRTSIISEGQKTRAWPITGPLLGVVKAMSDSVHSQAHSLLLKPDQRNSLHRKLPVGLRQL